jgi:GMP synthase (glutamine-hydrolysing)
MRLHYLQHVPFENPGCILDWANENNVDVKSSHLYKNDPLPELDVFDLLVVMGGAMGANDDDIYPWMPQEKKLIESAINANKKVIGICLGSQFLADVLGVKIYANSHKEIGWFPIEWSDAAQQNELTNHMPKTLDVFHWHGDTYDLPPNATHLAKSRVCQNQAFLFGNNVLAVQFHLEVKEDNIKAMLANCADELVDAPYIQSREKILEGMKNCDIVNDYIKKMLDKFCI